MLEIITDSHTVKHVEYTRSWVYKTDEGMGFSFPCDKDGNIFPLEHAAARENLAYCQTSESVIDKGIERREWYHHEPARALCYCGIIITLDGDSMGECECDKCGRVYNIFGQELQGKTRAWVGKNEYGEYYDETDAY